MKTLAIIPYTIVIFLSIITSVFATPIFNDLAIDFTKKPWHVIKQDMNNGIYHSNYSNDNITVTVNDPDDHLTFSWVDGLGIFDDEISGEEYLTVDIEGGMDLTGIWLSNLFAGDNNYSGDEEEGWVIINNDNFFKFGGSEGFYYTDFTGDPVRSSSGGYFYLDFNGIFNVESAVFMNSQLFDIIQGGEGITSSFNDFSVIGFTGTDPTPEPGTIILYGIGLLAFTMRKRSQ